MTHEYSSTVGVAGRPRGHGSHASPIWPVVDRLLAQLDPDAARAHGLVPLTAERLRSRGEDVPQAFLQEERAAKIANLIAPSVLARARDAYDGLMLVIKGPEVSALYPGRARMLADLDLLVADAPAARNSLLAVGFEPADRLEQVLPSFYHVNPVELPGIPLQIELHKTTKWPTGLRPPPNEALFEAAVPSSVGVQGLLAPAPVHHAVLLAGHAWAERPLERFRDLIDVAVMANGIDSRELEQTATGWGWGRVWRTTRATIEWLIEDAPRPAPVRLWAKHLAEFREPTVKELQLRRWLSPFWGLPPASALREIAYDLRKSATGKRNES
jgi:putative nucleotidyltransferase-like protein